ncbi:hypothetical protein CEP54_013547 [Fusarium duplospermum]|uniref:Zonadhesin n=1 Tax=Fusarium duplospermum TaxID=1325734 RepID=A0A428P2A7_9HYPO|nr:hypothetical protein CEP54_013547 [Fusarium duplospermum]
MYPSQAGVNASAFDARYEPQATDDSSWDRDGPKFPSSRQKRANYRPTALRWYFIAGLILCIMAVMGLVVWAELEMPNSEDTATIIDKRGEVVERQQQQQNTGGQRVSTTLIVSEFTKLVTVPGTTGKYTTMVPTTKYETSWEYSTTVQEGSTIVSSGITLVPTVVTTEIAFTQPPEETEIIVTSTITGGTVIYSTASGAVTPLPAYTSYFTSYATITSTRTMPPMSQSISYDTYSTDETKTIVTTIVEDGTTRTVSSKVTQPVVSAFPSVGETTAAPSVYVSYGKITITSVYTIDDPPNDKEKQKPNQAEKPTAKPEPKPQPTEKVINVVTVDPDRTVKKVEEVGPVTYVTKIQEHDVETLVISQGRETVVSKFDAVEQTVNVVATGADGALTTNQVVQTKAASFATIVKPIPPTAVVSKVEAYETTVNVVKTGADGLLTTNQAVVTKGESYVVKPAQPQPTAAYETTLNVVTTGADGLPTTNQVVETVQPGAAVVSTVGAYETTVDVVTTGADGLVTTNKVVMTHGASLVTIDNAADSEPTTFVSSVEAFETTIDVVSTGADGLLTTGKVVTTKSASLATIVKSADPFKPTTILITKGTGKAKLTTITSDRKESSTFLSTIKGTTRTYSKTTTVAPTSTDESSTGETDEDKTKGGTVKTVVTVYGLDPGKYFLGKFLPAMLAVMLSIPARVIDLNAQQYQPFYALNRPNGAMGPQSMNLHFSGWTGFLQPFKVLSHGHPVPFISMLIVWCSALMAPTAVEAIGFKMHGKCRINAYEGCAPALGVSPQPTHLLLALLAFTIVLLCCLLFFLRNWDTGLYANPWSVAGIASLASNREIRPKKASEHKIAKEMAEKRYGFGLFENRMGQTEYGIVLYDDAGANLHDEGAVSDSNSLDSHTAVGAKKRRRNPFMVLGLAWRLVFLAFLLGLMAFLLYYHLTLDKPLASFRKFMNSQTFGVRFLFAAFGVIISFTWTAFFNSIAMIMPYQVMSRGAQTAANSVLLTRPTNGVSGFWSAIKHGQLFAAIVSTMNILSEFMPILLSNIPYSLSQVRIAHDVCTQLSVGILSAMALTIISSFVVPWPDMPVDPRSVAGAMYYVSESVMVDHFSGMASMDNKERERRIRELGGTYMYGELTTRTGEKRPAVEWDDRTLGIIPTAPQHPMEGVHMREDTHSRMEGVDTAYHGYQPGAVHT